MCVRFFALLSWGSARFTLGQVQCACKFDYHIWYNLGSITSSEFYHFYRWLRTYSDGPHVFHPWLRLFRSSPDPERSCCLFTWNSSHRSMINSDRIVATGLAPFWDHFIFKMRKLLIFLLANSLACKYFSPPPALSHIYHRPFTNLPLIIIFFLYLL